MNALLNALCKMIRNNNPIQLFICLFLTAGVVACSSESSRQDLESRSIHEKSGVQWVKHEALVKTSEAGCLKAYASKNRAELEELGGEVYLVKSTRIQDDETPKAWAENIPCKIDFAQRNEILSIESANLSAAPKGFPRDPKWFELWGLKNYGQDAPGGIQGKEGADISVLEAWKKTKGSREVVVAVIDTGIDYTHPDLKDNMWVNEAEKNGVRGQDDDANGYTDDIYGWDFVSAHRERPYYGQLGDPDPMDDHGHGTHCAGTVGAMGDNQEGVVGVSWKVSLMALKFLSENGSGSTSDAFRAIRYAADNGVDIISASYGGGLPNPAMQLAIDYAGKKGVLFVAAAGNDGANNDETPQFPSSYLASNIISVAASDSRDRLASFSNYGSESVDIAAPGVAITSTYPTGLDKSGSPYRTWSGTSMATPHVAGAAALILSLDGASRGDPVSLKDRLLSTVDRVPNLYAKVKSQGRLNVGKAVNTDVDPGDTVFGVWKTIKVDRSIPCDSYPCYLRERADAVMKLHAEGAKAIQPYFEEISLDRPYDTAVLYDSKYRRIQELPALALNQWAPVIEGDTAYIKFSNSKVAIKRYEGTQEVDDPSDVEASFCWQEAGDEKWTCTDHSEPSEAFYNFNSGGVRVTQMKVLR